MGKLLEEKCFGEFHEHIGTLKYTNECVSHFCWKTNIYFVMNRVEGGDFFVQLFPALL